MTALTRFAPTFRQASPGVVVAVLAATVAAAGVAPSAGARTVGAIDPSLQSNVRFTNPDGIEDVSAIGDHNGDGRSDLLLGVPDADGGAGEAFVVFGASPTSNLGSTDRETVVNLANLSASRGFRITAPDFSQIGLFPSAHGDVNGDGIDDLIIGARPDAYVIFGTADPAPVDLSDPGSAAWRIDGENLGSSGFTSFGFAPDMNGDGRGEVVLGNLNADLLPGGLANEDSGSAFVVYGQAGTDPVDATSGEDLGADGFEIRGAAPGDQLGTAVAGVPDVNGDGRGEVLVGAPRHDHTPSPPANTSEGAAYVVFGRATGDAVIDPESLGNAGYAIRGPNGPGSTSGCSARASRSAT